MTATMPVMLFSPDFISAVEALAASEADAVGRLIAGLKSRSRSDSGSLFELFLPPEFLLALGLALRFQSWELSQIRCHLNAGLPSGAETLIFAIRIFHEPELGKRVQDLSITSLGLFQKHFVWRAKTELQVDLGFQDSFDDDQLDAIAEFLWSNRHALQTQGETT